MCQITKLSLPERYIPDQYIYRAKEASKILSVTSDSAAQVASRVALAELGQVVYFAALTIVYALTFTGVIGTTVAGGIGLALLPLELSVLTTHLYTLSHSLEFF